jgi:hypothetical protein
MNLCYRKFCLQVGPTYSFNKVYFQIFNLISFNKSGLCFDILSNIFSFSTIENILDAIFTISSFQRVILSTIWSFGSQDMSSGS